MVYTVYSRVDYVAHPNELIFELFLTGYPSDERTRKGCEKLLYIPSRNHLIFEGFFFFFSLVFFFV